MRASGMRNYPYLIPLIAFLIVLLFFLLYHYSGPDDKTMIMIHGSTYQSRKQELVQTLRKVTRSDRTVILTIVNESLASPGSVLDVFLQGFKHGQGTQKLLNHLVIVTMDTKAYEYCRSLHPHCIHPSTFVHYFASKRQSITNSDHNASFSWRRNNVLLEILDLGYNIVFTEVDVLWLRSPFSHFDPIHELSISCNFPSDGQGGNHLQDGGIFFLKANAIALEFFKYWKIVMLLYPKSHAEESLCTTIAQNQDSLSIYGFRVKYVDTRYFGGFCHIHKDKLKEAYAIHANCCEDLTSKVHDLRIVLDDWINYRTNVSVNSASDKISLMRQRKCPGWKSS